MSGFEDTLQLWEKKLGSQPWYVWAGVVAGGGVIGWYVLRQRAVQSAAATNAQSYVTPGADDFAAMNALNGLQLANMAGVPYGYQNANGPVDNYPQAPVGDQPIVSSTPTATPPPVVTSPPDNTPPPGAQGGPPPQAYAGLLGPNVSVNFANRTYTSSSQKTAKALPVPSGDKLVQGAQNRVWYIDNGHQYLLTEGYGAPVTNSGYPTNTPQNTAGAYGGVGFSDFHVPVNSQRSTIGDYAALTGIGMLEAGYI